MITEQGITLIGVLILTYLTVGVVFSASNLLPSSKDDRVTMWRIIIWPVVLLILLAHKVGPFCTWFIKELREAPIAIARALRFNEEK